MSNACKPSVVSSSGRPMVPRFAASAATGVGVLQFVKDEFDAFVECGVLAHGVLRLRCGDCGHHEPAAFSCKRRRSCVSCGARRPAQTAAHRVDHVTPQVPAQQAVLSLPIPLRLLPAAQPPLLTRRGCRSHTAQSSASRSIRPG